ncbi:PRC and DUF2382 domain-containing protein [Leifsonia shinshuensis]|uniref:PRC and DUF2382 domain-containing protein n=1 Tax=Leifsonia shinshuensis TaxID=150026 RepID=UPI00286473F7|nr:PRC and DUF2382 domain-containing protein [Leifsonia shinshuensis]MDR6971037.1 uncharacterized protein (TIGR02271 family) [Leifsonia shinshuensis]
MINENNIAALIGTKVIDRDGDKIGSVGQIYVDPSTGRPNWASVRTGLFGTSESFVPLDDAVEEPDGLRVPFEKAVVKDAPRIEDDAELSPQEEEQLYSYYRGNGTTSGLGTADATTGTATTAGAGHDTSGPNTDDAMTRSEERLDVGTERVETGRARLRKYVVTENQQVEVPVTREEVRVEREPITDANVGEALDGPELSEEEHEVVLHEERPVVDKETVPVERVRLDSETVTGTETVNEDVRKERIDVEGEGRGSGV